MSFKKVAIMCLVLMFIPFIASAKEVKNTAYYKLHARKLINQATALGAQKGYTMLTIVNANNGATGAAEWVSREDPQDAAVILIAVARTLIDFARATRYPPINPGSYPQRGHFYTFASDSLYKALRYIQILAKTNPIEASNMAIQVATVFFNANPDTNPHRNSYRSYAQTMLTSGNSLSAHAHALKISHQPTRNQQLLKIKNQAKAMGF